MFKKSNAGNIALINVVLYAITVGINYLGAGGFINGLNQKTVSDRYMTLITPAPVTFAIWGVIYTLLFITLIYFLVKKSELQMQDIIVAISPYLWLNFALNALWITLFSFEMLLLSTVVIFGILLTLTQICLKLHDYWYHNIWLPGLTFGIYSGWVTIATVVNVAAALIKYDFNGFGISYVNWAVATLLAAFVIINCIAFRLRNAGYTLAVAWAFWGIHLAHQSGVFAENYWQIDNLVLPYAFYFIFISIIVYWSNSFRIAMSK